MAKAKANIANLSDVEKVARGCKYQQGLRGNTKLAAGVGDQLADEIEEVTDALQATIDVKNARQSDLSIAVDNEQAASNAWSAKVPTVATQLDVASGGDAETIISTNFEIAETSSKTRPAPDKVMNLHASVGDEPGHIDLAWNGDENATAYADQIWQGDDVMSANWAYGAPLKGRKSKAEVLGLSSGLRYWFRVRASNTLDGPWSDPISIIAP